MVDTSQKRERNRKKQERRLEKAARRKERAEAKRQRDPSSGPTLLPPDDSESARSLESDALGGATERP